MVYNITGLGVSFSSVRNISLIAEKKDIKSLSQIIHVVRTLLFVLGALGMICVIFLSSWLSKFTFGDEGYKWSFVLLSIVVFFNTVASGEVSILQGTRKIKKVAIGAVLSSLIGLIFSLPIYYWWGIKGIASSLVVVSISYYVVNRLSAKTLQLMSTHVSLKVFSNTSKSIVKVGFFMMIGTFVGSVVTYCINIYIRNFGNIEDVGFYQAGISMTNQYVGLVFAAMASDFYPRLSAIGNNNIRTRQIVNQQAEIVVLIILPLLIIIMLSIPILIPLLLSNSFLPVIDFVRWVSLGLLFKAASYPLGFISFARGDVKIFLLLEVVLGNIVVVFSNIIGYKLAGLTGMGIGFFVSYVTYFILCVVVTRKRFNFAFNKSFLSIFLPSILFSTLSFISIMCLSGLYGYIGAGSMLIFAAVFSLMALNKRLNIKHIFIKKYEDRSDNI